MKQTSFAPREVFEQMLQYMPIATFDLILFFPDHSVIVVKRIIEPYKDVWALPGLRMLKGETIDDVLARIATQEIGITINPKLKQFVGQFVGKFKTENNRQDISTCYAVPLLQSDVAKINSDHFSRFKTVTSVPQPIGAMYKSYLNEFFDKHKKL